MDNIKSRLAEIEYMKHVAELCVEYVNRDIQVHQVENDCIRNTDDAIRFIISFNNKIDTLLEELNDTVCIKDFDFYGLYEIINNYKIDIHPDFFKNREFNLILREINHE